MSFVGHPLTLPESRITGLWHLTQLKLGASTSTDMERCRGVFSSMKLYRNC